MTTRITTQYRVVFEGGQCVLTYNLAEAEKYIEGGVQVGQPRESYAIETREHTVTTTNWIAVAPVTL